MSVERGGKRIEIVVAGDVCLDMTLAPRPGNKVNGGVKDNWRLTGELRPDYSLGGAVLLAKFIKQATGEELGEPELHNPASNPGDARGPVPLREADLPRLTRDEIVHSILELASEKREEQGKKVSQWRVREAHGFSGPDQGDPSLRPTIKKDSPNPDILVLDDTGNGFRRTESMWPKSLGQQDAPGLIIHKLHRPLPETYETKPDHRSHNPLWDLVRKGFLARCIAVVDINDLRAEGVMISRGFSWEKTTLELLWNLRGNQRLAGLRGCRHLIVRIGMEAALYYFNPGIQEHPMAWLIYDPGAEEGGFSLTRSHSMVGIGSAFVAGLCAGLLGKTAEVVNFPREKVGRDNCGDKFEIVAAIKKGLAASRQLFHLGFGGAEIPAYPQKGIFERAEEKFASVAFPIFSDPLNPDPQNWSILNFFLPPGSRLDEVAAESARRRKVPFLENIPVGKFKNLTTYDRHEIEAYRAISVLLREYLQKPAPERPLSLAVFGPPGSGKSFGVENVAEHVQGQIKTEKLTFNVSQFQTPEELAAALHLVRDAVVRGKVPLVFFDEFDAPLGEVKLGWLKYFLAPMQDGVFLDRGANHPIGKAIFVFAGGIYSRFEDFQVGEERPTPQPKSGDSGNAGGKAWKEFKEAKGPDFVSRLRGTLNVVGVNHDGFPNAAVLLRRANILAFQLGKKVPGILDSSGEVRIDEAVLRALLHVPRYHHGARSMEAILDMSALAGCESFSPSCLPQPGQMALHVDDRLFNNIVLSPDPFGDDLDPIAQAIHEDYLAQRKKDKTRNRAKYPSHRPWAKLDEDNRNSNRNQARMIPERLHSIGYFVRKGQPRDMGRKIKLNKEQVETLARAEHERWMAEKISQGWVYGTPRNDVHRIHDLLLPWDDPRLSEKQKDKDRQAMRMIPVYLEKARWLATG